MRSINLFKYINTFIFSTLFLKSSFSQNANLVVNGGFELKYNCSVTSTLLPIVNWNWLDSLTYGNAVYYNYCYGDVPYISFGFQYPRTGDAFAGLNALCQPTLCNPSNSRGYLRNRLKTNLQAGKVYCVKFFIAISNNSTYGIDAFGAYFGDDNLDTINYTNKALTYLSPQIQNSNGNVIIDTLSWTPITGTFTAIGNEKHLVIGNFKSDVATTKTLINVANLPQEFTNIYLDDVSCIDIDLPAYAGPDVFCVPGNSVYIGRQRDVGIDEACMWYKLPNMTTAIDTAAGIWVSPTATSTYVVRQEICAGIKYDTVVVTMSGLGFGDIYSEIDYYFSLRPNPTKDKIELNYILNDHAKITIQNNLGQLLREEEINFINTKYDMSFNLPNGIYFITISNNKHKPITKKLIVQGQ